MNDNNKNLVKLDKRISAAELMKRTFQEPRWAVPGILPEGLSILGGKPKKHKSFFGLNAGLVITSGKLLFGKIQVEKGPVIYLALEDSLRRVQERLDVMLQGEEAPEQLYICNAIDGDGDANLRQLEEEIKKIPNLRLVVIDTLAKFFPSKNQNSVSNYEDDYQRIAKIKSLADKYCISILLIHHLRKQEAENVMDTFLGSQGLTGAADGLLAMVDGTGQSDRNLIITGRDIEETTLCLKFDPDIFQWTMLGNASETRRTPMQQKISDVLKGSTESLTPTIIAEKTGLREQYVKNTLPKLTREGVIIKTDRGLYTFVNQK